MKFPKTETTGSVEASSNRLSSTRVLCGLWAPIGVKLTNGASERSERLGGLLMRWAATDHVRSLVGAPKVPKPESILGDTLPQDCCADAPPASQRQCLIRINVRSGQCSISMA